MYRTIIENDEVKTVIDSSRIKYPRLPEAWDGLKWLLSRRPDIGKPLGFGENILLHKQDGSTQENVPSITVLYFFDNDKVEIKAIKLTDANEQTELQGISKQKESAQ